MHIFAEANYFMKFMGEEKITTSNHPIKKDKKPLNKTTKKTNGEMNTKKIKKIQRWCYTYKKLKIMSFYPVFKSPMIVFLPY